MAKFIMHIYMCPSNKYAVHVIWGSKYFLFQFKECSHYKFIKWSIICLLVTLQLPTALQHAIITWHWTNYFIIFFLFFFSFFLFFFPLDFLSGGMMLHSIEFQNWIIKQQCVFCVPKLWPCSWTGVQSLGQRSCKFGSCSGFCLLPWHLHLYKQWMSIISKSLMKVL